MAPRAPLPDNEEERLKALHNLKILDTPLEARFERITRLAQWQFKVSIAAISLVDTERQWFKSHPGLSVCETSRDVSFCAYAIHQKDELFIVPDALLDPRFSDNALVTGEPFIRFYAAYPLKDKNGMLLGTFCIIDQKPRHPGNEEQNKLREIGKFVELEVNRRVQQEDNAG